VPAEMSIIWLMRRMRPRWRCSAEAEMNQSCSWRMVRTCCQAAGKVRWIQASLGRPNSGAASVQFVEWSLRWRWRRRDRHDRQRAPVSV